MAQSDFVFRDFGADGYATFSKSLSGKWPDRFKDQSGLIRVDLLFAVVRNLYADMRSVFRVGLPSPGRGASERIVRVSLWAAGCSQREFRTASPQSLQAEISHENGAYQNLSVLQPQDLIRVDSERSRIVI